MVHGLEKHKHIDHLVEGDIHRAIFRNLHGLDEVKLPDDAISLDLDVACAKITQNRTFYNFFPTAKFWRDWPTIIENNPEVKLAQLMNEVGNYMRRYSKTSLRPSPPPRKWTARYANTSVPHNTCKRKPDIVLMNQHNADAEVAPGWDNVLAVVELKLGQNPEQDPVEQLAQYARLVFGAQPDRFFMLGVAIIRTTMTFVVFNRSGLFVSDSFDVHEEPLRFMRVVAMMFLGREYLGFAPRFDYTPVDGNPSRTITVNCEAYEVEEILYTENVIRGRGTVCLSVKPKDGGENLVVKSSWVDVERQPREPEVLADLKDVPGITRLKNSETVDYRTRLDFDNLKEAKEEDLVQERKDQLERIENREPVRVVLTPLGTSILKINSLREFVGAMEEER